MIGKYRLVFYVVSIIITANEYVILHEPVKLAAAPIIAYEVFFVSKCGNILVNISK